MASKVLSVRVRGELLDEARRLGINVKEVVERALRKEIEERRRKQLEEAIREGLESLRDIDEKEWIKTVREIRRER